MRNQYNDILIQRQQIQKVAMLRSEISHIQWVKIGLSLGVFIPMLMLLGNQEMIHSTFLSVEMVLGYTGTLLVVLGYFFLRELYLASVHNRLIDQQESTGDSGAGGRPLVAPVRNPILPKYTNMPYPIG